MAYKLPTKPGLEPPKGSVVRRCGDLPPKTGNVIVVQVIEQLPEGWLVKSISLEKRDFSVWLPTREEN